jgi:aryl-alcohol dehydrogenase-like predicted oxidoreductase
MEELNKAVKAGKVREIGCSNFSADQLRASRATHGPAYFASVQNEYSLFEREPEAEVLPECAKTGVGFLPYFPLANGLLTGKYRHGSVPEGSRAKDGWGPKVFTQANLDRAEKLAKFAESQGHTLLELAISWLAARREVSSVIAGAKTAEQVRANAKAASWKLTEADQALILAI